MKILVACEISGIVREAFRKRAHAAKNNNAVPADQKRIGATNIARMVGAISAVQNIASIQRNKYVVRILSTKR